ncbi:MAG: hypothetical protein PHS41_09340, partial [Victivallaceae bacterium]|nr:hypothetical protein [Victivallaceae bacterium]
MNASSHALLEIIEESTAVGVKMKDARMIVSGYSTASNGTFLNSTQTVSNSDSCNNTFSGIGSVQNVTNGYVADTTLKDGASLILAEESYAQSTSVIGAGSFVTVASGSILADSSVVEGGMITVMEDGALDGVITIGKSCSLRMEEGSLIDGEVLLRSSLTANGTVSTSALSEDENAVGFAVLDLTQRQGDENFYCVVNAKNLNVGVLILVDERQNAGTYQLLQDLPELSEFGDGFQPELAIASNRKDDKAFASLVMDGAPCYYNGRLFSLVSTDGGDNLVLNVEDYAQMLTPVVTANTSAPTNENVTLSVRTSAYAVRRAYAVNGGSFRSYSGAPLTIKNNSVITVRSFDAWGNYQDSTVTIDNIDKTRPVLGKLKPEVREYTVGINLSLLNQDSVDYYIIDGKQVDGSVSDYEFEKNTVGKYTLTAQAVDFAGNVSAKVKASYTVADVTAPTQVTEFGKTVTTGDYKAVLSWELAEDNVGVSSYSVQVVDADGVQTSYTSKSNRVTIKKVAPGEYTYYVQALDKAGNAGAWSRGESFEMKDDTAPVLNRSRPSAQYDGMDVTIFWKA